MPFILIKDTYYVCILLLLLLPFLLKWDFQMTLRNIFSPTFVRCLLEFVVVAKEFRKFVPFTTSFFLECYIKKCLRSNFQFQHI